MFTSMNPAWKRPACRVVHQQFATSCHDVSTQAQPSKRWSFFSARSHSHTSAGQVAPSFHSVRATYPPLLYMLQVPLHPGLRALMHKQSVRRNGLTSWRVWGVDVSLVTGFWILGIVHVSRVCAAALRHGIHDVHPLHHSVTPQQDLHAVSHPAIYH